MITFGQFCEGLDKNIKLAIQKGDFDKKTAFTLRKHIEGILTKLAKGDEWTIKKSTADLGLYYKGTDGAAAGAVGRAAIGAIYDVFQKGSRREVTRVVKTENSEDVTYTVTPSRDPKDLHKTMEQAPRPKPQITFSMNKRIEPGGAVIAVNITPNWSK